MSDEIKSIKDLNPTNIYDNEKPQVEEEQEVTTVEETTDIENVELADSNVTEEEQEDLSLGTVFDFGDSIARRREILNERATKLQEEMVKEELEKEFEELDEDEDGTDSFDFSDGDDTEDDDDNVVQIAKPVKVNKEQAKEKSIEKAANIVKEDFPTQNSLFIDDEDFDDIEEDNEDFDEEESLKDIKKSITDKLQTTESNLDISGFTIVKKPVSVNTILSNLTEEETFEWVLMSAGKTIAMKPFSGSDIEALAGGRTRNRFNNMKDIYMTIYSHIVDPNKPKFEAWLKTTSFMDIAHIHMSIYNASFNDANYIPYTCTNNKCNNIFLSENIGIIDMVKFKDDDAENKFNKIISDNEIEENCVYETRIIPLNNQIAIGFREPSIYHTIFENVILDQKFIDKYTELLGVMVYIDDIYYINGTELIPVALPEFKNNIAKTTKARISTYAKIIKALPSDAYGKIKSVITDINESGEEVTYQSPEVTCPKCGHTLEAEPVEVDQMLFRRHQLVDIANS